VTRTAAATRRAREVAGAKSRARVDAIRAFMLAYQAREGHPPKLDAVCAGVGLKPSCGLASRYMQRMAGLGMVRKVHERPGIGQRWEAVA
jgi:hypothetical protein